MSVAPRCHHGRMAPPLSTPTAGADRHAHHRGTHRCGTRQGRPAAAADDPRGARRHGPTLRGRGGRAHPPPHPRRRPRPDPRPGAAARGGGCRALGDRPRRPALDRRVGARPAGGAAHRPGRGARLVLADVWHDELRRRRLPQPLAVHERPLRAGPGARGRSGVRALRPRSRARPAAAVGHARPSVRRTGARRLRHRRAGRDAGHDSCAHGRGLDAAGRGDVVVRDRDRPWSPADHGRGAVGRRAPARRHGGQRHVRPRAGRGAQRRTWCAGRPSSPPSCSVRR